MRNDYNQLYNLIDKQFEVIKNSISFITGTVDDAEELISEAYILKKDTFELLVLMRAYRDMLEEIL